VRLSDFALAVYGRAGVSQGCLLLQDRFGLDVNLLLFAAYVGADLTPAMLEAAAAGVDEWHREVVRPLRAVRRRLKHGPAPAPDVATAELRDGLKHLEVQAELVELTELERFATRAAPRGDPSAAVALVLRRYSDRALSPDERDALATIAAAAVEVDGDDT
jgi:uncharacterized protein (TIGR02444 family)